jgi:spore maturation protein CgeB
MFSDNYKIINAHPYKYQIKRGVCRFSKNYFEALSKDNNHVFFYKKNDKNIGICSKYFPIKNAKKMVENFECNKNTIIILGLLCGYELEFLAQKYPEKSIFVVEPDKNLFNLFLKYSDLNIFSKVHFLVGWEDYEIAEKINFNKSDFCIFENKQIDSSIVNYFSLVKKRLFKYPLYDFSEKWRYRKFAFSNPKILYIDSSYVLTKECLLAFKKLNIRYRYIHIEQESYNYAEFIKNILQIISEFKPDFVMTINHLGFDNEGRFTEILEELELPYVSWFVDSPNVILDSFHRNISEFANIFVWDKDYIKDLQKVGYKNVEYLPLATSPEIFFPKNKEKILDVSFVGSSMFYAINKNVKSFLHKQNILNLLEITAEHFIKNNFRFVSQSIEILSEKYSYKFDTVSQKKDFEAAVLWRATQIYRLSGIKKLAEFNPYIYGDSNWEYLLDDRFNLNHELSYYDNLAEMYNLSKINFNMTSRQMKNSVNQRIFDVPAVKGFLLTDYKEQLEEIFDLKTDIAAFKEVEEIPDLVKFYLKKPLLRRKMSELAYEKVVNYQNYEVRIKKIVLSMQSRYLGL